MNKPTKDIARQEVLKRIAQGKTFREIAKELGWSSTSTVSHYLHKRPKVDSSRLIICPSCHGHGVCPRYMGEAVGKGGQSEQTN